MLVLVSGANLQVKDAHITYIDIGIRLTFTVLKTLVSFIQLTKSWNSDDDKMDKAPPVYVLGKRQTGKYG